MYILKYLAAHVVGACLLFSFAAGTWNLFFGLRAIPELTG